MIFIFAKEKTRLATADSAGFHDELYRFVSEIDAAWLSNPEWTDPQGYDFTDFTGYPYLWRHLDGLCFYSRDCFNTGPGAEWIQFRAHGGAYTTDWMRDALLDNIRGKLAKYAKSQNKLKLQQQQLDEFYLLA